MTNKTLSKRLMVSLREGRTKLAKLSPLQRSTLEKVWDVEHAYYSSTLEGSKLDKKEFEQLAKKVK